MKKETTWCSYEQDDIEAIVLQGYMKHTKSDEPAVWEYGKVYMNPKYPDRIFFDYESGTYYIKLSELPELKADHK